MKNILTGFIVASCIVFVFMFIFDSSEKEQSFKPYIYTAAKNIEAYYSPDNLEDYLWLLEGNRCVIVAKKGRFFKIATDQGYFWIKEEKTR